MNEEHTQKIREQNDVCRQQIFVPHFMRAYPCKVVHTQGIEAFCYDDRQKIYEAVASFDQFTEDNDPHQEHDFGAFEFKGEKIFWKFDYYDPDCHKGSIDPANPKETMRVLTILLASEY